MTDECDKCYVRAYHSPPCILLTPNNSLPSTCPPVALGANTLNTISPQPRGIRRGWVDKEARKYVDGS